VIRYLRLYVSFLRFSFSRALEFRLDFFFRVVMDGVWYATHLAFFALLFQHTGLLGGWTLDETLIFAGALFVGDAINMTVFSNNMWWFPIFVNRGDLDYYLVRPVSPLFFLSLRDFAANSFLNLGMAVGILVWALVRFPGDLPATRLLLFALLMGVGAILHYALHMIFLVPVFWMHNASGLRDISYSVQRCTGRPDAIYRGWVRRLFVSVLPFAMIVSFPVRVLLGDSFFVYGGQLALATVGSLGVLLVLWRFGLRAYSSASS